MDVPKNSLMKRWQAEGRWEAIDAEKLSRIRKYRSEKIPKTEASDRAWLELAEKYPPIEPKQAPTFDPEQFGNDDADFVNATLWVFDNLAKRVSQDSAPGAGAWAMLQWARDNQNDFFKSIMPKALEIKAKAGGTTDEAALEEIGECEGVESLLIGVREGEGFSSHSGEYGR